MNPSQQHYAQRGAPDHHPLENLSWCIREQWRQQRVEDGRTNTHMHLEVTRTADIRRTLTNQLPIIAQETLFKLPTLLFCFFVSFLFSNLSLSLFFLLSLSLSLSLFFLSPPFLFPLNISLNTRGLRLYLLSCLDADKDMSSRTWTNGLTVWRLPGLQTANNECKSQWTRPQECAY